MALIPEQSSRRFDVVQKRIEELSAQERGIQQRTAMYRALTDRSPIEQITHLHSLPVRDRLQHAFAAKNGAELRSTLLDKVRDLPETSAGIANKPFKTKIGIISDLFLYKSFDGLADFRPIYPENYQEHSDIDILLLVSTWRGIDDQSWAGLSGKRHLKRKLFEQVLPFYRDRDIPIVFYSKEDPPNYDRFLPFAQRADYIFTSAEEMIPSYERDCPEAKSIDVLPFGINPINHSPVGSQNGDVEPVIPFAGSWFNHKYEERGRWGSGILDAVMASKFYDLLIFDRNSHIDSSKYRFPNRYARTMTPSIDHKSLLDIQRLVDVSINLNSVQESSSMFANRALELQAQGTLVLSNYNVGINSHYPHVHISNGYTDTLATLNSLSEVEIRKAQADGIRSVFSKDLAIMRVAKILETVGLSADVMTPRVGVVKHDSDQYLAQDISNQSYSGIDEVVEASDLEVIERMRDRHDIVVHMGCEHEYAPTHVEDLVNAFRYTSAVAVEKIDVGYKGPRDLRRHSYSDITHLKSLGAEFTSAVPDNIDAQMGYKIDEIGVRRRAESIEISSDDKDKRMPAILSVVVPIYNNGPHLLYKCIASLRRSSIFRQMELILVDDGSTDVATVHAVNELERELEWVQVYRYESGGSGSASRPRNKGLELASCDYVTYLDPDNEALNDGYVRLLRTVIETESDFAVGNMTRWRDKNSPVRYTKFLQSRLSMTSSVARGGADALVDMQFMPISIQALVARTDWLRGTGISQPVGAVGQDSYFFQQMLYYADTFAIVNVAAHTYYAQVENSVVNTVNAKFFDKYLPLEQARSAWLSEVDLLEEYKRSRMETFFVGWYLRKLADVPLGQRSQAIRTIAELGRIYGGHEWQSPEAIEFWDVTLGEVEQNNLPGDTES